uniref:Glycine--tRNA ligase beta subunit n=1 Tax=Dictyoglomus thermophilum TaxID=14 RepID=A0A7C3MJX5_DICTH
MERDLLVEIGTEEMPASFLEPAIKQIKDFSVDYFEKNYLRYSDLKVWATPRRLVIYVEKLKDFQESQEEEIRGPAAHIAYKDGEWTDVAKKFAEQNKADLKDLIIKDTSKGRYVFLKRVREGKPTIEIIQSFVVDMLKSIRFPKMMKWGNVNFTFGRPIRWILSLYGDELVPISVAGVNSSKYTRPPRFYLRSFIEVSDATKYLDILRENFVIVDHIERKDNILKQIKEIAEANSLILDYDAELLDEVNFLVEYPTALLGHFDERYLKLPDIVLKVTLEKKQRYFPLRNEDGNLVNRFIVIRNGTKEYADIVIEGNERVLKARLADAEYYFNEDIKNPLESYTSKLEGIIFQEKLGTIKDKVERVKKIVYEISRILSLSEDETKILVRCVDLYKADLGTLMVSEYPELHAIMGSIYAKISGEKEPIPTIIGEYIYPRTLDEKIPSHYLASLLGIADRIDSLAGYFFLGLFPTGSEDPIGLRRITGGLLKIFLESDIRLSIKELLEYAWKVYGFGESRDRLYQGFIFIGQRLRNILLDMYPLEVVESVLSVDFDPLWKTKRRIAFIIETKKDPNFNSVVKAFNRLYRILPKELTLKEIRPELFVSNYEKKLYEDFVKIKNDLEKDLEKGDYLNLFKHELLITFANDIEAFFDNVLVMSPNEDEKNNRLSLIWNIKTFLWEFCDWSKLS